MKTITMSEENPVSTSTPSRNEPAGRSKPTKNYKAWVAKGAKQPLLLETVDLGPLGAEDVEVAVEYCGWCHHSRRRDRSDTSRNIQQRLQRPRPRAVRDQRFRAAAVVLPPLQPMPYNSSSAWSCRLA